ncbi:hypothetical protein SARC_10066 [Sphaeroforma arctica JP610]|uniref:Phospholipid/glycerol acyltransferase domain-containing protein n=1 Tax=Sphaeroforma arctica JP610 TaxID=667725 RepID=A0A0L0FLW8_9EUKA|nr:hypothetical protein SARC_10066 [Sphaeroforma arctica JP610]KNC77476.1 hypothetical protein SARC_10066 [Sphaeroforma arctica JP610]|eukprot:XP_014151378.1 hypothetical protein SARC_10066 [Sphaeroforma arctica JP610]
MTLPSELLEKTMVETGSTGFGALFRSQRVDMESLQKHFHSVLLQDFRRQLTLEQRPSYEKTTVFGFLDFSPFMTSAMESVVQDNFSICFECMPREPWNWNLYLFPMYLLGVTARYLVLLPLRLGIVFLGLLTYFVGYVLTLLIPRKYSNRKLQIQRRCLQLLANCWVASWAGVIKYHGSCPPPGPNQIIVANHSTVLDIILMLNDRIVSLIGQKHGGTLGFFQEHVLNCMNNLWFDRLDTKDRTSMSGRIKEHIMDPASPPLMLFPEGTCVNNEYAVMFKRGAFDLDATIIPVAIKYNRLFGDAFWNSKLHSFPRYCLRLWTSWCVVADVWYLEAQTIRPGETSIQFAARVKEMICTQAGLTSVPWDGYLKYFRPSEREKRARQAVFADLIKQRFDLS